ncbi:MAG: hypothetical protein LAO07_06730 [Acidobacteriia bacterium]|nr:hypothetical protein [Terriglobia bacterium]
MIRAQAQIARVVAALEVAGRWARAHGTLVALILIVAFAGLWLLEHDARLRREFELHRLRTETQAEVADLRARAAAALGELKENARLIEDLESRRRTLAREAEGLRQRLTSLREEEGVGVQQAATLPPAELAKRVAARLGRDGQVPGVGFQVSGNRETGNWTLETSKPPASGSSLPIGSTSSDNGPRTAGSPSAQSPAPNTRPNDQFPISSFQFPLTEGGLRQVETSFLQLDACREQAEARDRLVANCEERVAAAGAQVDKLNDSLSRLQEAVRLKDEIAARTDAAHRAELKAARGTWRGRFVRALQYVGVGVVIGMVAAR